MSGFKYESPDDFEKFYVVSDQNSQSPSRRPSMESRDSDWFLNKRASKSSSKSSDRKGVTSLHPAVEVPLAILTFGLSVAAFHAVKSISDRRNAKELAAQSCGTELHRSGSFLVPSSIPEHHIEISEMQTNYVLIAELDGPPANNTSPAYSAGDSYKPFEME